MNAFLSIVTVCLFCSISIASRLSAVEPEPTFEKLGVSSYRFEWTGEAGLTYFVQYSQNLQNWQYFPLVDHGLVHDPIDVTPLDTNGNPLAKYFMRLVYTDVPTVDAEEDDFDYDGLPNLYEVSSVGSDPLDGASHGIDSDADGLYDAWELLHFGNLSPVATGDADGDGLTNLEEMQVGLNPLSDGINSAGKHVEYDYDAVGRLLSVDTPATDESMIHDDEGNITGAQ